MKKIDRLKTVQLIVFMALTLVCCLVVFSNTELFHTIALNSGVRTMCMLLWAALGLSFLFIFIDFSTYGSLKREYRELDYAVHSDPIAGIANRYSSDVLIEKYLDRELPRNMGAVMLEISNIKEINENYGHLKGNEAIRIFGAILKMASIDICFVSRNGGNRFLAIFEDSSKENITEFINRVNTKIHEGNNVPGKIVLEFKYGTAFNEKGEYDTVIDMISASFKRMLGEQ